MGGMVRACLWGLAVLLAVWAFVSYLQPAFSGEQTVLLYCF